MIIRPVDEDNDILPVLTASASAKDLAAMRILVYDNLNLLSGDWWENNGLGNAIINMLKEIRYTEADKEAISSYLTTYIRSIKDVENVTNISCSITGRQLHYTCTIITVYGETDIEYSI